MVDKLAKGENMKTIFAMIALTIFSTNAHAGSCYSGYKDGQDPDKYYAPDGTEFESSKECVKYAKSLNEPSKDKSEEEEAE